MKEYQMDMNFGTYHTIAVKAVIKNHLSIVK
jgi:hypothetical protein